jgi:hypothetical protein
LEVLEVGLGDTVLGNLGLVRRELVDAGGALLDDGDEIVAVLFVEEIELV